MRRLFRARQQCHPSIIATDRNWKSIPLYWFGAFFASLSQCFLRGLCLRQGRFRDTSSN